ncbi:MAG: DNA-3-methyladenine glycosylase [Anaerolineales bacterium]|nr:DNA-3-methyladenine glycosylase [Anaerolineales bacterium]
MSPVKNTILPQQFYKRPTLIVARELLGKRLVRVLNGNRLAGIITETEAYIGETDLACHARAGKTPRTDVMYGPAGIAYVYFTYGMHWLLNAVTEEQGLPAAVLIRAIHPVEGLEIISERRLGGDTNGPAKLTQALGVDGTDNRVTLTDKKQNLWIEMGEPISEESVTIGPRVGLNSVPEPWKSIPWRYLVQGSKNLFVK